VPKRTNHYQKLLLYINQALAPFDATVTESAMLWDKASNQHREIDILIECSTGPYPTKLGIECTERKRKLGVKDVEQIYTKHRNVGINSTVMVANSGYFKPASEFAKNNSITLLTFDAAMKLQWPDSLKALAGTTVHHFSFTCTGAEVSYIGQPPSHFDTQNDLVVHSSEYGKLEFHDYVYHRFNKEEQGVLKEAAVGSREWKYRQPLRIIDSNGVVALISTIKLGYRVNTAKVELDSGELNGSPFGYGVTTASDDFKRLAVVAAPNNEIGSNGTPKIRFNIHLDTE